jgi:hypothetical protein
MVNERLQCYRIGSAPFSAGVVLLGGRTMTGLLTDSERAAWIRGDRASRYRERAEHLKGTADAETRPSERARVLELAVEYARLADELAGQKKRNE